MPTCHAIEVFVFQTIHVPIHLPDESNNAFVASGAHVAFHLLANLNKQISERIKCHCSSFYY